MTKMFDVLALIHFYTLLPLHPSTKGRRQSRRNMRMRPSHLYFTRRRGRKGEKGRGTRLCFENAIREMCWFVNEIRTSRVHHRDSRVPSRWALPADGPE